MSWRSLPAGRFRGRARLLDLLVHGQMHQAQRPGCAAAMLAALRHGSLLRVVDAHSDSSEASCMMSLDAHCSVFGAFRTETVATVLRLHVQARRAATVGRFHVWSSRLVRLAACARHSVVMLSQCVRRAF